MTDRFKQDSVTGTGISLENEGSVRLPRRDFWAQTDMMPKAVDLLKLGLKPEAPSDAMVVLDANILLKPYEVSSSLEELGKIYNHLMRQGRLVIPGQAVREFFNKRPRKILEIGDKINALVPPLRKGDFEALSRVVYLDEEFKKAQAEYESAYAAFEAAAKPLQSLAKKLHILNRQSVVSGEDALSLLYRETFERSVYDPVWTDNEREALEAEFWRREASRLPPGFKDQDSNGDFILWKTILHVADKRKLDCILVTEDLKTDWFIRANNNAVSLRPELIAEYAGASGGKNIYPLKLSDLMKIFRADADRIGDMLLSELRGNARRNLYEMEASALRYRKQELEEAIKGIERQILSINNMFDRSPLPPVEPQRSQRLEKQRLWEERKARDIASWTAEISELSKSLSEINSTLDDLAITEEQVDLEMATRPRPSWADFVGR